MQMELNKLRRERDDFKDEVAHLQRKVQKMESDQKVILNKESDMMRDLNEAKSSMMALRAYEFELQKKEKNVNIDPKHRY